MTISLRSGTLVAGFALAFGVATATPALAASTPFSDCVPDWCSLSHTDGTITWFNRTANVQGTVTDIGAGTTQAIFKAFAGTTQIGPTQTRTADDESSNPDVHSPRSINFTMGDTNLVGGINKITVQVCSNGRCSVPTSYFK